ncbi:MAG: radical SAM protein [Victivallaceae bacterium]
MNEHGNKNESVPPGHKSKPFTQPHSLELIRRVAAENRLLSIEIEPTLSCNYHCPYCYAGKNAAPDNELSYQEITGVIKQAKTLGAERVIILGGEPLLYPDLFQLIDYISSLGMSVELFSNGALLTVEIARKLFKAKVRLALKLNSFKEDVQTLLTGEPGGLKKAMQALENAIAAGYPGDEQLLAVSTVICQPNVGEMEDLWRYLRDRNITPYFEVITPQGSALDNAWLQLSTEEIRDVFEKLAALDREYGYNWEPRPPLVGDRCLRHQYSCLVTSIGNVFPCVGIDVPVGNVRENSLQEIIIGSEIIQDLRKHLSTIKAPCGECELADECYGCRGTAYQLTGDWLASDPLCWRSDRHKHLIQSLPMSAAGLIPHQASMRMVDTLEGVGEKIFFSAFKIMPDNLFLSDNGEMAESAYIEMIAQTMAAGNSFREQTDTKGMLIGVKDFQVHALCRVGDELKISCIKKLMFDNWGVIYGEVRRHDELVAEGELKIWMS